MKRPKTLPQLAAAFVAAGLALPAIAGPKETELLEKLLARMEKLEARNAELEKEVKALKGESEAVGRISASAIRQTYRHDDYSAAMTACCSISFALASA